jgi:hypothetical protein
MKIGFSYSRCVRDLVDGHVSIDDILVIVSRTNFDPRNDDQWQQIWQGYGGGLATDRVSLQSLLGGSSPEWVGYTNEDQFRQISIDLWNQGKLHQPRQFGPNTHSVGQTWVDTEPLDSEHYDDPVAVKEAWNNYKILKTLSGHA